MNKTVGIVGFGIMGGAIARNLVERGGCATPLFTLTQPVYAEALAMGLGDQDTAAVFEVLKKTIITDPKSGDRDHA
jgi:L-threonate 2-dehydrogenase